VVGKSSAGAIDGTLRALASYGVLNHEASVRGTREIVMYSLNPAWESELEDARLRTKTPGSLGAGERLILVPASGLSGAARWLRRPDIRSEVAWAAESDDSSLGLVVALRAKTDVSGSATLLAGLQAEGVNATRLRVSRVLAGSDLDQWATRMLEGSAQTGELMSAD
jgi:hypothetical protein